MGLKEELMKSGRQEGRLEAIAALLKNDHHDLQEIARTVHLSQEAALKISKLITRQKELASFATQDGTQRRINGSRTP